MGYHVWQDTDVSGLGDGCISCSDPICADPTNHTEGRRMCDCSAAAEACSERWCALRVKEAGGNEFLVTCACRVVGAFFRFLVKAIGFQCFDCSKLRAVK